MLNFTKLLFIAFFVIIIWGGLFSDIAISGLLESRLNNLESKFSRLESQVNRLEMQGNRGSSSPKSPNNSLSSQHPTRRLSQSERDKMFDNLANLVIELRQDVKELQQRVSQLENTDN
ncbi:MAG: hypothetical protein VKN72_25100 [Nostocales cyanobacterium 94392]|nr:hypothetical protein [Nostocales cyanobacterium 94392]